MSTRTISNAGGNWNAVATWVEGVVPTTADDIVATPASGNLLLNTTGYCRSLDLTGYTKIFSNASNWLYVGATTCRNDAVALCVPDGVIGSGLSVAFYIDNQSGTEVSISLGNTDSTKQLLTLAKGPSKLISPLYAVNLSISGNNATYPVVFSTMGQVIHLSQNFSITGNYNSVDLTGSVITMDLGSAAGFSIAAATILTTGNNTLILLCTNTTINVSTPDNDLSGFVIIIKGPAGYVSFTSNLIIRDLVIDPPGSKSMMVNTGKTVWVNNDFVCFPKGGLITFTGGSISKSSGVVKMCSIVASSTQFTGGATWEAYHNSTASAGLGINVYGGKFYVDFANGDDSIWGAYGWWKVAYSGATGTLPSTDEQGTGAISGATGKVTGMINSYEWANGSGTLFFYGKVGTFTSETINFASGGSMSVTADFTASAWQTIPAGAKSTINDEFRFAKSPDPTSTGQYAQWTSTTNQGGGIPGYTTPVSSTNSTPIQITKTAHGYLTGDVVHMYNHTVNTNANGIWLITKLTDNTFSLDDSTGNGTGAATGYVSKVTSKAVVLSAPVTETICLCDTAWTPGTSVTSASLQQSYWKFGAGCPAIITGSACAANQIIAKTGLPASLDLSAKKQISFWFRPQTTAITAGQLQLRLYSDAACSALVETFDIPAIPGTARFVVITIDKGSPLSGTVQGVALYTTIALPSKTFYIDNILACKDSSEVDSITLNSLLSKNHPEQNGDNVFIGIQSIKGRIILLDNGTTDNANSGRGYCGVTESCILYKREGIKTLSVLNPFRISLPGLPAQHIKYTGGYNKITNLKDGLTVFDGCTGNGYCMNSSYQYIDIDTFQFTRYDYGFQSLPAGDSANIFATNCGTSGLYITPYYTLNARNFIALNNTQMGLNFYNGPLGLCFNLIAKNNAGAGISLGTSGKVSDQGAAGIISDNNYFGVSSASSFVMEITLINSISWNYYGLNFSYSDHTIIEVIAECNHNFVGLSLATNSFLIKLIQQLNYNGTAVRHSSSRFTTLREITECCYSTTVIFDYSTAIGCEILSIPLASDNQSIITMSGPCYLNTFYHIHFVNTLSSTPFAGVFSGQNNVVDCDGMPATQFLYNSMNGNNFRWNVHNYNRVLNDHRITSDGAYIVTDDTERHTVSGISWKFAITNTGRSAIYPMDLSVTKVICTAGIPVTAGIWVKKSNATDISGRLIISGNKYEGIGSTDSDVAAEAGETTDWHQITITFTPVKTEVIEIKFEAYWVAGLADEFLWIDDLAIVQTV